LFGARHRTDERFLALARAMARDTGADAFLRQQNAIIGRPDSRPTLATITRPTFVVVGDQDRITAVSDAEAIAAGVPGAQLVIVEDCGHLMPLEQPTRTTELLRQWLGRTGS
ncbi:MAG: alpha/beta fold hydrolase, partial [Steroidobacteraceae bacterium]